MEEQVNKISGKTLSIIGFIFVLLFPLINLIFDFTIFSDLIGQFFLAIIISGLIFLVGIVLMFVTIIFIFGIYLIEDGGFWPLNWAHTVFSEMIGESSISTSQINGFITMKVISLILYILIFILMIVALSLNKKYKKDNIGIRSRLPKAFGTISLILSIIGIISSIGLISLFNLLL